MPLTSAPAYIQILSDGLNARKQRNPRYSLRAFARFLGIDPSSLSRILSGKQELSVLTCRKLVQRLDLPEADRERFILSVAGAKANRAASALSGGLARQSGAGATCSHGPGAADPRSRFLVEALKALCGPLQDPWAFSRVARAAVAEIADACVIVVLETNHEAAKLEVTHRDPGTETGLRRFLGARAEALAALCRASSGPGAVPLWDALSGGLPESVSWLASELPVGSLVCAPVLIREGVAGLVLLANADAAARFDGDDLEVLEEVARRIATTLDNQRMLAEAYRTVKTRDDLVAVVSHDLRNPLTAIVTCADMLLKAPSDEVPVTPLVRRSVETIHYAAERMHHLVSGLLSMSKSAFVNPPVKICEESVHSLLKEAVLAAQPIAAKKGIRILMNNQAEGTRAVCDREQILRVLSNLLGNAMKFSPDHAVVQVDVCCRRDGEVCFSVRDQGCGIPEEHIPHVFDRYWQAKPDSVSGAGLGLSIAREIVVAHGGEIWLESRQDQGTAFYFNLPAAGGGAKSVVVA